MKDIKIGVDFDNTIVCYDLLFYKKAIELGLVSKDIKKKKGAIRDYIRTLPDGELLWQKLQAYVYGPGMDNAVLIAGVKNFFLNCKVGKIPIYIISHKSVHAKQDIGGVNLRAKAMKWMVRNGFFDAGELDLSPNEVCFGSTRKDKIDHIRHLGCTHFIDDLVETFQEESFPSDVEKILFAADSSSAKEGELKVCSTWKEIGDYIFK
jgi:hypothetical protein